MRNILFIFAALVGFGAFGQTNIPTRIMLADSNGVVKMPTNITRIRIGGTDYTNLLGFGLSVTNGQLSVDTTQLPSGGGGGGSGTVTSVAGTTTVSGLGFSGSPVTTSGTLSLTGTVAVASGGTGGTDAATARSNLGVLSSRWLTGFGSPSDYSEGIGTYYVNLETYQVWEQTGVSTFETIPFFVMGEGVYSYLDQPNTFSSTNTFLGAVTLLGGISGNGTLLTNLNGTEIRSGTVADARIDSAIARLASPAFTGSPTAPTASPGTSNTVLATTAYVLQNAGGGGDVTQSGNNTFTGTNTFSGTTTFNDLAIGTITVVSNLTVPNNPYGAGWNGSTNVPNENSVYDEMELRAPKANPSFTGAATNTGSFGAPTLYVGSTNVAAALASISDTNWNGTPVASGTITSLTTTTQLLNSAEVYNLANGDAWAEGNNLIVPATAFLPFGYAGALASGTLVAANANSDRPSLNIIQSSGSANSGWYVYATGDDVRLGGSEFMEALLSFSSTNATVVRFGFLDSNTSILPVDGAYVELTNGWLYGVTCNNSTFSYTTTSNRIVTSSTSKDRIRIRVNSAATSVNFQWLTATAANVFTTNWTADITSNIPTTRDTSHGLVVYNTTGGSSDQLVIDALGLKYGRANVR